MLAAIYNVFDGEELLKGSIDCLKNDVDHIIIVWQDVSNFGEFHNPMPEITRATEGFNAHLIYYRPDVIKSQKSGMINEARKRNIGLTKARELGCTHFLHIDVDEYYHDFATAKQLYFDSGRAGSVCRMYTYFKRPTLRLEQPENYYVPFIHEIKRHTRTGFQDYPFHVDPTRKINESDVGELPIKMHHFSWVRKSIARKARNSSAKNLSQHLHYYDIAENGTYLPFYQSKLIETENLFNIDI